MKIALLSDLHTEFSDGDFKLGDALCAQAQAACDVLILAGDIGEPFMPNYAALLSECSQKIKCTLLLAGNREYYANGATMAEVDAQIDLLCCALGNVHYLNNRELRLGGVTFIGSTLWSYIPPEQADAMSDMLCFWEAYTAPDQRLTPEASSRLFTANLNFLAAALDRARARRAAALERRAHAARASRAAGAAHATQAVHTSSRLRADNAARAAAAAAIAAATPAARTAATAEGGNDRSQRCSPALVELAPMGQEQEEEAEVVVVVTHHAPLMDVSQPPEFRGGARTSAYASDLRPFILQQQQLDQQLWQSWHEQLRRQQPGQPEEVEMGQQQYDPASPELPQPPQPPREPPLLAMWVSGHTHHNYDVQVGGTRVVTNQYGYQKGRPLRRFRPGLLLEVGGAKGGAQQQQQQLQPPQPLPRLQPSQAAEAGAAVSAALAAGRACGEEGGGRAGYRNGGGTGQEAERGEGATATRVSADVTEAAGRQNTAPFVAAAPMHEGHGQQVLEQAGLSSSRARTQQGMTRPALSCRQGEGAGGAGGGGVAAAAAGPDDVHVRVTRAHDAEPAGADVAGLAGMVSAGAATAASRVAAIHQAHGGGGDGPAALPALPPGRQGGGRKLSPFERMQIGGQQAAGCGVGDVVDSVGGSGETAAEQVAAGGGHISGAGRDGAAEEDGSVSGESEGGWGGQQQQQQAGDAEVLPSWLREFVCL